MSPDTARAVPETLLCTADFSAGTGFAWTFFERLYASVADRLAPSDVRTLVAYPLMERVPTTLAGSTIRAIELDTRFKSLRSLGAVLSACRRENIRTIWFTDRDSWHWTYPLLRLAGVRRIFVYDHMSGVRTVPRGLKRAFKSLIARLPGMSADKVACASDYLVRRQIEVNRVDPSRVERLHYGLSLPDISAPTPPIQQTLDLERDRPVILTACRAAVEKGVHHLFRAFDLLLRGYPADRRRPLLVYVGSGPYEDDLKTIRSQLASRDSIVMTGYRNDVETLQRGAAFCVVPSIWQDALPLAVLGAMASGCAVIATRVGGIPEMIDSERVGVLVEAGDEPALAAAMRRLLEDPETARAMGKRARERVGAAFRPGTHIDRLVEMVRPPDPTAMSVERSARVRDSAVS